MQKEAGNKSVPFTSFTLCPIYFDSGATDRDPGIFYIEYPGDGRLCISMPSPSTADLPMRRSEKNRAQAVPANMTMYWMKRKRADFFRKNKSALFSDYSFC